MSYSLINIGETIAYDVQYRLIIRYKCITGFTNQSWTNEFLPSSTSLYSYGNKKFCAGGRVANNTNITAGKNVDFNDSIQLCSGLGIESFTFEVYQVIWD